MASLLVGGTYRIGNIVFPAPATNWEDQVLGQALDGFPIINSYRIHTWSWATVVGEDFENLASIIDTQMSTRTPVSALETDPYDASGASEDYGTFVYTDFIIQPINRQRGLPEYEDVTVQFEVYVP